MRAATGNMQHLKTAPSSAPFGGTFPLEGGRLTGATYAPLQNGGEMAGGSRTRPYEIPGTIPNSAVVADPRPACGRPQGSPLRRKRTGSVGSANPGAEVEPQRAQILHPQAPSGAGLNCGKSLRFCAPEILQHQTGARPPAILWVLSHRWESTSPPGRRNSPAASKTTSYKRTLIRHASRATFPQGKA